jgi:hypothetical protein
LGNVREIHPGDVNWMTAGRGIVHSERTPHGLRAAGPQIHGIQSWVALPDGAEDIAPDFVHHPAATLPRTRLDGVDVTVISGQGFGLTSPVTTLWPTLYVHADLLPGASLPIPVEHTERAVYVVEGSVVIDDATLAAGSMGILGPVTATAWSPAGAKLMLLGGERFPTPRHLYWNFVASSQERIEAAKERWRRQEFPAVPQETEFIPLPS